jgi:hypothetical protein
MGLRMSSSVKEGGLCFLRSNQASTSGSCGGLQKSSLPMPVSGNPNFLMGGTTGTTVWLGACRMATSYVPLCGTTYLMDRSPFGRCGWCSGSSSQYSSCSLEDPRAIQQRKAKHRPEPVFFLRLVLRYRNRRRLLGRRLCPLLLMMKGLRLSGSLGVRTLYLLHRGS